MSPDDPTEVGVPGPPAPSDPRPPRGRLDPAAMRETLDAARRRLGPGPSSTTEHSAKELRALLREAAADQAAPPDHRSVASRSLSPAAPPSVDETHAADPRD